MDLGTEIQICFFSPFFCRAPAEQQHAHLHLPVFSCFATSPDHLEEKKNRSFDAFFMDLNLKAATACSNFEVQSETEAALRQPELTVAPSCT